MSSTEHVSWKIGDEVFIRQCEHRDSGEMGVVEKIEEMPGIEDGIFYVVNGVAWLAGELTEGAPIREERELARAEKDALDRAAVLAWLARPGGIAPSGELVDRLEAAKRDYPGVRSALMRMLMLMAMLVPNEIRRAALEMMRGGDE